MIAQMFMRNETTAIPMMQRYNVSYVVVFVTYARTQEQGSPSFLGAGEDGKWYWMVRIANQTSYGNQTILFQEKRVDQEVTYYRLLKSEDKIIANETISSGQELEDNSVLGFMMNTGVGISQGTSNYLDRVFTSSNNFVLVYKVLYPKTTIVTLNIDKNNVKFGESARLTGTVTDKDRNPYRTGAVTLQTTVSTPQGVATREVATVSVADGNFSYDWTPQAGNHSVTAQWNGVRGEALPAVSDPVEVRVQPKTVTLTISLSNFNMTLGQNVTVSLRLSEKLSNGTLTIQYSTDGKKWVTLETPEPKNGTADYLWVPTAAGTFYIRAQYSGSGNLGPATSDIVVLYVRP